jgi:hypothetical protein
MSAKTKSIHIVGTSPSSRHLAPFSDPSAEIWAMCRGSIHIPRCDKFFEIHGNETLNTYYTADDISRLKEFGDKVFLFEPFDGLPEAQVFDRSLIEAKHSTEFLQGTPNWLMAHAIEAGPQKIGLWGVDMESATEYEDQRPGMMHFIEVAKLFGIEVDMPVGCPLASPKKAYPFRGNDPMRRWLNHHIGECTKRLSEADTRLQAQQIKRAEGQGFIDALKFARDNWT